jgi:hypothetical protein
MMGINVLSSGVPTPFPALGLNAPTLFTIDSKTDTTMTVSWTAPAQGSATEYRIKDATGILKTVAWGVESTVVTGLTASTSYTLWIVTSDGASESLASNTDTDTTNAAGSFTPTWHNITAEGLTLNDSWGPQEAIPPWPTTFSATNFQQAEGTIQVDNAQAYAGTQSIRFDALSTSSNFGTQLLGISSNPLEGKETWFQFKIRFPTGFNFLCSSCSNLLKFIRLRIRPAGTTLLGNEWMIGVGGTGDFADLQLYKANEWWQNPPGNYAFGPQAPFVADKWHVITIHHIWSSDPNIARERFWMTGSPSGESMTLLLDTWDSPDTKIANLQTPSGTGGNIFLFSFWNGGAPQNQSCWVDGIVTSDEVNPFPLTGGIPDIL